MKKEKNKRKYDNKSMKRKALFRALSLGFLINHTRDERKTKYLCSVSFLFFEFSHKPNTSREKNKTTSLIYFVSFLFFYSFGFS